MQEIPLFIRVTLARPDALIPQDATTRVTGALMAYLQDAETRPRMGTTLYASRLATAVNDLGSWADVLALTVGMSKDADQSSFV